MHRIGLLAPFQELPGELADVVAEAAEPAALWQVITEAQDSHELPALLATGDQAALSKGVERMLRWDPEVVAWGCTSGSFAGGRAWALDQVEAIEGLAGVPATSTSLAFVEALAALGAEDVALLSPYPPAATAALADFLGEWGVRVGASRALGYPSGSASSQIGAADVEPALRELDGGPPILIPDTAVWGFALAEQVAPGLRSALLTANQVTLWHAFDLAGMATDLARFGPLRNARAAGVTRLVSKMEG